MLYCRTLKGTFAWLLYERVKDTHTDQDYFLFIYDVLYFSPAQRMYLPQCTERNTWNISLRPESIRKDTIMHESVEFGFGDQSVRPDDTHVLVKGVDHKYIRLKGAQAHIVPREEFTPAKYDPSIFVAQTILRSDAETHITQELNVFVLRDLKTRKLNTYCIMLDNDTRNNINRKWSTCSMRKTDLSVLGDKKDSFLKYMDHIKLDFGRVEILNDASRGWCVIDINNTPGIGEMSSMVADDVAGILASIIKK